MEAGPLSGIFASFLLTLRHSRWCSEISFKMMLDGILSNGCLAESINCFTTVTFDLYITAAFGQQFFAVGAT